jgi:hypothetical protein
MRDHAQAGLYRANNSHKNSVVLIQLDESGQINWQH